MSHLYKWRIVLLGLLCEWILWERTTFKRDKRRVKANSVFDTAVFIKLIVDLFTVGFDWFLEDWLDYLFTVQIFKKSFELRDNLTMKLFCWIIFSFLLLFCKLIWFVVWLIVSTSLCIILRLSCILNLIIVKLFHWSRRSLVFYYHIESFSR
jgi:uncharacterized protein YozE (UPF0346 family)